jgi:thiosulfate dehydrogenase [quinone] large subunit
MSSISNRKGEILQDPPIIQKLFNDSRAGWLWFLLRIWVGWQWISASEHKIFDPGWMVTGDSLKGFWMNAVKIPATGKPPISFDWYRSFLMFLIDSHSYTWFAKIIATGELLVGIGLILGAFTGIAAFFGALMNFNFMLAGSASTNPVLFAIAVGLVLAWKVAGYVGADYFLLRWIGTPWQPVRYPVSPEGAVPATKPASGD